MIRSAQEVQDIASRAAAEVVSVDMFDTLVFRRCARPSSVFLLQHPLINAIEGVPESAQDWRRVRMSVERSLSEAAAPNEVTIEQVYDGLASELGLSAEQRAIALRAELAVEERVIRPYGELIRVLAQLHAKGVEIVVTTDTYLPIQFIRNVLEKHIAFPFSLLCSSETNAPKRSGLAYLPLLALSDGRRLVHFGDNRRSDVKKAREAGVAGHWIEWPRERFLHLNSREVSYLDSQGIYEFATPHDGYTPAEDLPQAELAWRWATVLADFTQRTVDAAVAGGIDEIWFLSRDCESIHTALLNSPGVLGGIPARYVHTSRAASYPLMAQHGPEVFTRWVGRDPTEQDRFAGRSLASAYAQLSSEAGQRILLVDVGWKGRIQLALQAAMPTKDLFGFYFSLDPACEPSTRSRASTFVTWDASTINQAAVEALAGYLDGSCVGYENTSTGWKPIFKPAGNDSAPLAYAMHLRTYLAEMLAAPAAPSNDVSKARAAVLRQLLMFPDSRVAKALDSWATTAAAAGEPVGTIVGGGSLGWFGRLVGRSKDGNLWPSAGFWSLSDNGFVVRILQSLFVWRKGQNLKLGFPFLRRQRW